MQKEARHERGEGARQGKLHHDRDFTYLLRYLRVKRCLQENFRGSTTDDFNKICELFFSEMRRELPDFEMPADDQRRSALDILKGILVTRGYTSDAFLGQLRSMVLPLGAQGGVAGDGFRGQLATTPPRHADPEAFTDRKRSVSRIPTPVGGGRRRRACPSLAGWPSRVLHQTKHS